MRALCCRRKKNQPNVFFAVLFCIWSNNHGLVVSVVDASDANNYGRRHPSTSRTRPRSSFMGQTLFPSTTPITAPSHAPMHQPVSDTKGVAPTAASEEIWNDVMMAQVGASIVGDSALIDKETGRIYWEGGSSSISNSIAPFVSTNIGIRHLPAILVTGLLLWAVLSCVWWRILGRPNDDANVVAAAATTATTETTMTMTMTTRLMAVLKIVTVVLHWILQKAVPQLDNSLLLLIVGVYLLEAYICRTRRFLSNAITGQDAVEDYIDQLRREEPTVTWKVRCFHYEPRVLAFILLPRLWTHWAFLRNKNRTKNNQSANEIDKDNNTPKLPAGFSSPSLWTRKVVTSKAEALYDHQSWSDSTIAGVWRRAARSRSGSVPFSKMVLTKLLVLDNPTRRQDYFRQQSRFVTSQGQADEYAEFSTNIHVDGFRPLVLAVRSKNGLSTRLTNLPFFWICTLLGLTVPFRIWFSKQCDEIRITVTKETSAESARRGKNGSGSSSLADSTGGWLPSWVVGQNSVMNRLRNTIKDMSMYQSKTTNTTMTTTTITDAETNNNNTSTDNLRDVADQTNTNATELAAVTNSTVNNTTIHNSIGQLREQGE